MPMSEQIKCPKCRKRLFDLKSDEVELEIKCCKCGEVVTIERHGKPKMTK